MFFWTPWSSDGTSLLLEQEFFLWMVVRSWSVGKTPPSPAVGRVRVLPMTLDGGAGLVGRQCGRMYPPHLSQTVQDAHVLLLPSSCYSQGAPMKSRLVQMSAAGY